MPVEFEVSTTIKASAEKIYHDWLDSALNGEMTGGGAKGSTEIGGSSPPGMDISAAGMWNSSWESASSKPGAPRNSEFLIPTRIWK